MLGTFDLEVWSRRLTRSRSYTERDAAFAALQLRPERNARGIAAALASTDAQVRARGLAVLGAVVQCWTTLGYDKRRSPAAQATPLIRALAATCGEAILALPRDHPGRAAFVHLAPLLAVSTGDLPDRARTRLVALAQDRTKQGDDAAARLRFYFPAESRDGPVGKPPTCPRPRGPRGPRKKRR